VDADPSVLDRLITQLEGFDKVGVAIAKDALPGVERVVRATADAGTTPDGQAWAPKKSGGKALANASSAISVVVSGLTHAVITLVLRHPYVFHQRSQNRSVKKGLPRRAILPEAHKDLPSAIVDEVHAAAVRIVGRKMGGAR
jgi:hypothetical protein